MYVVQYHTLTWTEYARIFYNRDFWRTLSFHPNTTTLYLMISCKGELRNGTKYANMAYDTFCRFLGILAYKSVWLLGGNLPPGVGDLPLVFVCTRCNVGLCRTLLSLLLISLALLGLRALHPELLIGVPREQLRFSESHGVAANPREVVPRKSPRLRCRSLPHPG